MSPEQYFFKLQVACVQTSPISFVPRATKEIGDVCTQAKLQAAGINCEKLLG